MTLTIGILCFPQVQQLDLTGPYEVFASAKGTQVRLVWKTTEPVRASTGLWLKPDTAFAEASAFDVLCIPGGTGINALLQDEDVLAFVRAQAKDARYVTSVCTGSLVLGAAGLLVGRKATTHWYAHDLLAHFGAVPTEGRIVRDGNLITAGGITSGIDFGLAVVAELFGRQEAETVQLSLEYAPQPPFHAGTPEQAPAAIVAAAQQRLDGSRKERERLIASMPWAAPQS